MELQSGRQTVLPVAPAFVAVLVSVKPAVIEWARKALAPHVGALELHVVSCLTSLKSYPAETPVRCLMFESAESLDDAFAMLCAYHVEASDPIPTLLIKDDCNTEDRLRALALGAEDMLDLSAEAQRMLPLLVGRTAMVSSTQSHLVRNEQEFRAYLDSSPDGVAVFSDRGRIYANLRFRLLLESAGVDAENIHSLKALLPTGAYAAVIKGLEAEGSVSNYDIRLGVKQEQDLIVSARLRFAHFEGQKGLLVALSDVSADRRQQSQQKLHALGEMAAGVAHDFNNFLSAIIGRIGMLRRLVSDAQATRSIDIIEQAATDASQVVARMRSFARGSEEAPHGKVALSVIARDALEMLRPRWQQTGTYSVVQDLEEHAQVRGDATELREVLVNLLNNALDAMPDGGQLGLQTRHTEYGALVTVTDTGVGMNDEVRARAFDPFFSTKGKAGTGLGLSVSHSIMRRHGGSLQIKSSVGKGTTITLRFSKV